MSQRKEQVFGGIPSWLLADYLVDLGGRRTADTEVDGDGWEAALLRDPRPSGALAIGRVTVTIRGVESERIMRLLREKAQRGGG